MNEFQNLNQQWNIFAERAIVQVVEELEGRVVSDKEASEKGRILFFDGRENESERFFFWNCVPVLALWIDFKEGKFKAKRMTIHTAPEYCVQASYRLMQEREGH